MRGAEVTATARAVWELVLTLPVGERGSHDTPRVRFKMYTRNPYGTVARWQNPVKIVTEV